MLQRDPLLFLASSFFLLFTACASFDAKPIIPAATAEHFAARSLGDEGLQRFIALHVPHPVEPWPPSHWDLRLLTLVAFYYQPNLDLARGELAVAQAGRVSAGERANPTLALSTQYNMDAATGTSPWSPGATLDIPITTAGKRSNRLAQAEHLTSAARAKLVTTAWQIQTRVRAGMLELYSAKQTRLLLSEQASLQQHVVGLLRHRVEVGAAAPSEVARAQRAVNQIQLAIADAQRAENVARAKLATTIGVPLPALQDVVIVASEWVPPPLVNDLVTPAIRGDVLTQHAEIITALADYEASQDALQLEIAKQYPDLTLGPGYVWDAGAAKWSLALSLPLALLNRNAGPIAEASARRERAAANVLAVQTRLIGEIDQASVTYDTARQQWLLQESMLAARLDEQRYAAAQFKAGALDRLTLTQQDQDLVVVRLEREHALSVVQQAHGELEAVLQRSAALPALLDATLEMDPRREEPTK